MRMWLVDPSIMCRQHLLGEHNELHMFIGTLRKEKSITGYIENDLIEPASIKLRHDQLVEEMIKRGYNHKTPITDNLLELLNYLPTEYIEHIIDKDNSLKILLSRCDKCQPALE